MYRAFDDDDLALAAELLEQITRLTVSDLVIVGADITDKMARQRIGGEHDRDVCRVEQLY